MIQKVYFDPCLPVADQVAPELALRAAYLSTFGHMSDQASKIGMGNNLAIISIYDNLQVSSFLFFMEGRGASARCLDFFDVYYICWFWQSIVGMCAHIL